MQKNLLNTVAIYRVLYGEDFIQESILSILPHVDRIFVVKADKPWGNTTGVTYKGKWYDWPEKFDNTVEKVLALNEPKVEIIYDYWPTPLGQLTHIVNDIILKKCQPHTVVFIEPDHVFSTDEAVKAFEEWSLYSGVQASTHQVEFWKSTEFILPDRPNRTSVVFHRIFGHPMGPTGFNGASEGIHRLMARVANFGFCVSEKTMFWKHLTALAFSRIVGDSPPNEDWFEAKWKNWNLKTNNSNLEISLGYEWTIPYAIPCDLSLVPELILTRQ
jgi:hypothetical protein